MSVGIINHLRQASKGKTVFDDVSTTLSTRILKIPSDSLAMSIDQIIRTFIPTIYQG